MKYYNDGYLVIRSMRQEDSEIIHAENLSHGWYSDVQVYDGYFQKQKCGHLVVFIAEYIGDVAGYVTLRLQASTGPYANKGIPEVSDFNVFVEFRRKGIGNKLLDTVENIASNMGNEICLGVGLHAGYGSAQRLYIKRGYVPDGSGIWYLDKPLTPYAGCQNDDDLVLYFSKQLRL